MDDIERLAELARRCELNEVEVEQNGVRVRLRREKEPICHFPTANVQPVYPPSLPSMEIHHQPPPGAVAPEDVTIIASPMIGTFYRSPAPEKPAFIEVGAAIAPTTVVCIIEAMKVMNEIPAEISGTVVEVLAKDGQTVEFGQPLFKIKA